MSTDASYVGLPRCHHEDFLIYNDKRKVAGGFLKKKATQSSYFSKGSWQKRWFSIDQFVTGEENYELVYRYTPDDREPRKAYPLHHAQVVYTGGNSLQLSVVGDTESIVNLAADKEKDINKWYDTLTRVIQVATTRHEMIEARRAAAAAAKGENVDYDDGNIENAIDGDDSSPRQIGMMNESMQQSQGWGSPTKPKVKLLPSIRLQVDIETIPPSSTQRRQFEETFVADVTRAMQIENDTIEVYSIKPVTHKAWLLEVEFDIVVPYSIEIEEDEEDYEETRALLEQESLEKRQELMSALHDMIVDTSSPLYHGFLTCNIDASYSNNLIGVGSTESNQTFSTEPKVKAILDKYKDVQLPPDYVDRSHFPIFLNFDDLQNIQIDVPNPEFMRQRHCFLWPFEIKKAIGIAGTMQEQWVEPILLEPINQPRNLSHSIRFEPSCRMDGQVVINTTRLIPEAAYRVKAEDRRQDVLNILKKEEIVKINQTFEEYDADHSGTVERAEIEFMVKSRTKQRQELIEAKFQSRISEPGLTQAEIMDAEEQKRQHLQACTTAQRNMLKMYESADLNGDGQLSRNEFMLAEAWWLKCTLDPESAFLF
jgi:Ca2+-binding EF-hand superfamily protein